MSNPESERLMRTGTVKFSELSRPRRRLVENALHYPFCTIESLSVQGGEPVWNPPPVITSTVKFGDRYDRSRRTPSIDFVLKQEWLQFFRFLDEKQDFTIEYLPIDDGLPQLTKQREIPV